MIWSFKWGRIAGTPIVVDVSWLLLLPAITLLLARVVGDPAVGLLGAVLIYVANLGHEFAHVAAIRRAGGTVHDIVIFALGTIARSDELTDPRAAAWAAAVGPLYSLILSLVTLSLGFGALHYLGPHAGSSPAVRMTFLLAGVTLAFGCLFNLLPVWPMDGGRMLRAWLHIIGHSHVRTAAFCLGLTLALCGTAILWGSLRFAVDGSLLWAPKVVLATLLLLNNLAAYAAEKRGNEGEGNPRGRRSPERSRAVARLGCDAAGARRPD